LSRLNFLLFFLLLVLFSATLVLGNEFEFDNADQAISSGKSFLEKKDFVSGEQCFRKAVEIDPLCSDAWGLLGESMLAGKSSLQIDESDDEIPECLKKAIALDPKNHRAINSLGTFYLYLGNYPTAERYYQEAVSLNPDLIYISNLAQALDQLGKPLVSESLRKSGCDTYPLSFSIHLDYVGQMFSARKYLEALPYFENLIVLANGDPKKEQLVFEMYNKAKTKEAESVFSRISHLLKWPRKHR